MTVQLNGCSNIAVGDNNQLINIRMYRNFWNYFCRFTPQSILLYL